jgi:hypothetical protein
MVLFQIAPVDFAHLANDELPVLLSVRISEKRRSLYA